MVLVREGVESLRGILKPVLRVPESKRILDLLTEMQRAFVHLAVVKDEFGNTEESGFGAVSTICFQAELVQSALRDAGEDLTQERFIGAMEQQDSSPTILAGGEVSFGPDKHDGADFVNVLVYDLDCFCWVAEGDGEAIPIE